MRDRIEIIGALIREAEERLEEAKFYLDFYTKEYAKPTKIGKNVAMDNMGLYQKHVKSLEDHLNLLLEYEKWVRG